MNIWRTIVSSFELRLAHHRWRVGDGKAGRAVFERVPDAARPKWAANVLRCALFGASERAEEIAVVLKVAEDPARWAEGHQAFDQVRRRALQLEDARRRSGWSPSNQRITSLLGIAELVAKVTYNATNPPDAFDEDSGWWLASGLRAIVDGSSDAEFEHLAWTVLTSIPDRHG